MTCIVGFTNGKTTWIGGDTLGSDGYSGSINKFSKVFHSKDSKEIIMGYTTSFRMGQLLQCALNLFNKDEIINNGIDFEYLICNFIPKIQKLFSEGGFETTEKGQKETGEFLLAIKENLYRIQSDYSILQTVDNYNACGIGTKYALGALKAIENMDFTPIERIHIALISAAKFAVGVSAPFYIVNTDNNDIIKFDN